MNLLVVPGSIRRDSVNLKLARLAASIASGAGCQAESLAPADLELPLYHGDLEADSGYPDSVVRLHARFREADALLFCSPEYNSSVTPLLKNAIDWVSRPVGDAEAVTVFRGKAAGLLSASPGALGGLRGLVHLRSILGNIGMIVTPVQHCVTGAFGKFDDAGALTDEADLKRVEEVVGQLVSIGRKLAA